MKQIPLTQGKVALVDDADYDRLMAMGKWHYTAQGYAARSYGYKRESDGRRSNKTILMHRMVSNASEGMDTDHIDNDKLNNQRNNLRVCTRSENKQNCGKRCNNTSGYKGVSWSKSKKRWQVFIWIKYKQINLGIFTDKIEAAKVYNEAALKYHGEFARLNEI